MGNIVLLDDLTINKIAAGEVIERPASVVKELVENSIDAGANKINIETKNGGITYIRITDNGKGFLPDDMEMAFERHATSKIREASDLETVTSMGFRGEALASIAAISHVELVSKTADNEIGKRVEVKGGSIINVEDAGCPQGSTITVTDLFYNTPVRYKFLKKDFTEAGYIEDAVTRIALVHPEIAIKLVNSGKVILQTSGNGDMKSVIYSIYGKDVAENVIDVNYTYEDLKITGVVGKPVIARSNRANQLFFVNKRYIKDKILTSAAEQGYKGLLTIGKYGFLVLNMEMNPKKVDVNVHPAKLEVRFEDENQVFKAVYHAIKDSLLKEDLIPDKTKIELDKQMQSSNAWKIGLSTLNNFESNNSEKMGISNSSESKLSYSFADNSKNYENSNKNFNYTKMPEANLEVLEEPKVNIANTVNQFENKSEAKTETVAQEEVKTEETKENMGINNLDRFFKEDEEEKKEHKRGGLFGLFGRKKEQDVDEKKNVDDTQNFIAQIFNNKNGINSCENSSNTADVFKESDNNNNFNTADDSKESGNSNTFNIAEENSKILNTSLGNNMLKDNSTNVIETNDKNANVIKGISQVIESSAETVDATKTIDINEINEKMHKVDDLKLNTDYKNFDEMYALTFGKTKKEESKVEEENNEYRVNETDLKTAENISIFEKLPQNKIPDYKYIGIAFSTYIIIEMNSELYIIDQHAAHERIMYEQIKANYYNDTNKDSQLMLLPDIITLSHKDMQIAKDNMEIFEKAGFVLEEFGENTIKLSGVPTVCLDLDTKELFLETLDEINTVARTAKQEIEEKFIATVACKAAVKANMALTKEEVDSLMQKLLTLPNPFTCPHGRPTAIRMTKADIEKKFSRR